jgi:hypothetical protein
MVLQRRSYTILYAIFPYVLTHYDLFGIGDIHLIPSEFIIFAAVVFLGALTTLLLSVYREKA